MSDTNPLTMAKLEKKVLIFFLSYLTYRRRDVCLVQSWGSPSQQVAKNLSWFLSRTCLKRLSVATESSRAHYVAWLSLSLATMASQFKFNHLLGLATR